LSFWTTIWAGGRFDADGTLWETEIWHDDAVRLAYWRGAALMLPLKPKCNRRSMRTFIKHWGIQPSVSRLV
jgi:hypothetical protein